MGNIEITVALRKGAMELRLVTVGFKCLRSDNGGFKVEDHGIKVGLRWKTMG